MNWTREPIIIIICPHFWRKEWWKQRHCEICRNWLRALIGIRKGTNDINTSCQQEEM